LRTRIGGLAPTTKTYNSRAVSRDQLAFKGAYDEAAVMLAARPSNAGRAARGTRNTVCTAPIAYTGQAEVAADLELFRAALATVDAAEGFVPALSPENLQTHYRNEYYAT